MSFKEPKFKITLRPQRRLTYADVAKIVSNHVNIGHLRYANCTFCTNISNHFKSTVTYNYGAKRMKRKERCALEFIKNHLNPNYYHDDHGQDHDEACTADCSVIYSYIKKIIEYNPSYQHSYYTRSHSHYTAHPKKYGTDYVYHHDRRSYNHSELDYRKSGGSRSYLRDSYDDLYYFEREEAIHRPMSAADA